MNREKQHSLLVVIIVLLAVIAVALTGICGFLIWQRYREDRSAAQKEYTVVMQRNEENKYSDYRIQLIAGVVEIHNSGDNQVHYTVQADEKKLTVNEKDGTLEIIDKSESHRHMVNNTSRIILFVPSAFDGSFTIASNAGDITVDKFPQASLTAEANAGDIHVEEIANLTANCDAGNLQIERINRKTELEAAAGNVNIGTADLKESSHIKCNFGNITIAHVGDVRVNAVCHFGQSSVSNSNPASAVTLDVTADAGNVDIE